MSRRRALLGIEEQVTPQLPVPIHHFPLDQANGLNDIVGSGVLTPVSNRVTWNNTENKYVFSMPTASLIAANITNLAWGVVNGQPLNNLSFCFDIKINSFMTPTNWGIQIFTSGNIELVLSQGASSGVWYFPIMQNLKYIATWENGTLKVYFNGILIFNGIIGNANGVLNNQLNVGGSSSSSGGTFFMWNLKIFNKVLTDNEIDVLNNY